MLDGQARALVERGFRAIWYDRRGTGGSTRDDWPGGGADQHADDAAALLRETDAIGATVLGFSSGGVVALALAARHPTVASQVIAWEPAALGMLPGGADLHAAIVAPMDAHLAEHPGDWAGRLPRDAGRALRGPGRPVVAPEVKLMEANAEAALRDDRPVDHHACIRTRRVARRPGDGGGKRDAEPAARRDRRPRRRPDRPAAGDGAGRRRPRDLPRPSGPVIADFASWGPGAVTRRPWSWPRAGRSASRRCARRPA